MRYLLDTNAVIYHLQGAPELDAIFARIVKGEAEPIVSVITQIELLGFPRLTRSEETAINGLLAHFHIRVVDDAVARLAIRLRKKHHLGVPDCIIAATALASDAELVSRDEGMRRIQGLSVLNPFQVTK